MTIELDFETRSAADLRKRGTWLYSKHETTQVICFSWQTEASGLDVHLWNRATPEIEQTPDNDPYLRDLFDRIRLGETIWAHNAFFERSVWENALRREFPWMPRVEDGQWRCTAAVAASLALPRNLEDLADALGTEQKKDVEGKKLLLKLCKPARATKKHPEFRWHEDKSDIIRLHEYNKQDVRAEGAVLKLLGPLSPRETEFWLMDQRMNDRGVYCDRAFVEKVLDIAEVATDRMNAEIDELTEGYVKKGSDRAKVKGWVDAQGLCKLPDTQGITVETVLAKELQGDSPHERRVRRVLEICCDVNKTSTKKYAAMDLRMDDDDRIRDLMMYHGATTGRWAGKGIQPHNFPRGHIKKHMKLLGGSSMEAVCDELLDLDMSDEDALWWFELTWGKIMDVLSSTTRGALMAPEGKEFAVADFAAIEARCLLWEAMDEAGLDMFRSGKDIYLDMAEAIYNRKGLTKKDERERQMGKQAILGLGYQMGWEKFRDTCAKAGIYMPDEFFQHVVRVYRKEKYPLVESLWWEVNEAAIEAVRRGPKGVPVKVRKVKYACRGRFLFCELPSKRKLAYYAPRVTMRETAWGEKPTLSYMGTNPYSKQWQPTDTYGGRLVENITQAVARDLMADAMLRADKTGQYDVLLSVHDELVCEVDADYKPGKEGVKEFEQMMAVTEPWADGCPVGAEGWRDKRYRK